MAFCAGYGGAKSLDDALSMSDILTVCLDATGSWKVYKQTGARALALEIRSNPRPGQASRALMVQFQEDSVSGSWYTKAVNGTCKILRRLA